MSALDQRAVRVAVPGHPGCIAEFGFASPARIHDTIHDVTYSEKITDSSKSPATRARALLNTLVEAGQL